MKPLKYFLTSLLFIALYPTPHAHGNDSGMGLYTTHCSKCHGNRGEGGSALPLNKEGLLVTVDTGYIARTIRFGRTLSDCPPFEKILSEEEIGSIARFVKSWQQGDLLPVSSEKIGPRESSRGKELFPLCGGCHGMEGEGAMGPPLFDEGLLKSLSDADLRRTITYGRPGTPMKGSLIGIEGNIGVMTEEDVNELIAYIRFRQAVLEGQSH